MLIIADTGCLIHLDRVELLLLLPRVFGVVTLTPVVAREFGQPLPAGFTVQTPLHPAPIINNLDAGEASAIALALETPGSLLVIDEEFGREYARSLGLDVTGTLGVLIRAKDQRLLSSIAPIIAEMRARGMWLSTGLIRRTLEQAGEAAE